MAVYALTVAKGGARLQRADIDDGGLLRRRRTARFRATNSTVGREEACIRGR